MKDYGKLEPTFWTRGSGKKLRGHPHAQVVACYLFSAPGSNFIGIYYLPLYQLAAETGIPLDATEKALAKVSEVGIAAYDPEVELVYVFGLVIRNVGEFMVERDNRIQRLEKELDVVGKHPFAKDFWMKYGEAYRLRDRPGLRALESPFRSPSEEGLEPPSKPIAVAVAVTKAETEQSILPGLTPGPAKASVRPAPIDLSQTEQAACDAITTDPTLRGIVKEPGKLAKDLVAVAPGLNVAFEIKRAGAWLRANPKKKKNNGSRFLLNWLSSEQDKRGGRGVNGHATSSVDRRKPMIQRDPEDAEREWLPKT